MGGAPLQFRVFGGEGAFTRKKIEISSSEKCILVDPGDGFAMDNGERGNTRQTLCPAGDPKTDIVNNAQRSNLAPLLPVTTTYPQFSY